MSTAAPMLGQTGVGATISSPSPSSICIDSITACMPPMVTMVRSGETSTP